MNFSRNKLARDNTAAESKSNAKRLINQGAFEVNNVKIIDPNKQIEYHEGDTIAVGKFLFKQVKKIKNSLE